MATISIKDTSNFLSKLSLKRVSNGLKVLSSYYYSKLSGKPNHFGSLPFMYSFEPTTACNLKCPECPSGLREFSRATGNLKTETFKKVIDQISEKGVYLYFYFQGEPYINPNFLDFVKYASKTKKLYTVTSTNAHFLNDKNAKKTIESGLDRIIISIDGTTQETYENYRKEGELAKVLEGTKNLVAWKKKLKSATPHIIFQFLVVKPNEHQIEEVYELAKQYEVDEVKLKTAQVYNYEDGNDLIPTIEKYSRYKKEANGKYSIKNTLENHCWKMWHACVITWDGKVVPCCFDKDATHQLGDLQTETFAEVWNGNNYNTFRTKLMKSRKEIDICANCSEGTKVWA